MAKKDRQFWESLSANNIYYKHYYYRLTELAISMFEWKNLPDSVDPRYLELALFSEGKAIFFEDEVMGFLALRCMVGGGLDVYHIPTERTAYGSNGYNVSLDNENSVIIYNNYLHTNSSWDIDMYARRMWDLDRAIDVNAKAQKTPILIRCKETQRLTMKNLYKQYDGNEPFIFGDKDLDIGAFQVLNTNAPYVSDKLYDLRQQVWHDALTFLGISNTGTQKRERLLAQEAAQGSATSVASRYGRLEARRAACNEINKMFGLNIWCDYREDYQIVETEGTDATTGNVVGEQKKPRITTSEFSEKI